MFLSVKGVGVLVNVNNQEIERYFKYRYSGFCTKSNFAAQIVISERHKWSYFAKTLFANLKNQGKYSMCNNYKILVEEDYVIEVFENRLYILSNPKKKVIEFICPENEILTHIIASRLCVHLHMLLWSEGIFCLHGGATTYNRSLKKGIAIFGNSGMGKTSLVLSLTLNGERLVADDNLFLYKKNNAFEAIKNTQCVGLHNENLLCNFPSLCSCVVPTGIEEFEDKKRIDLLAFQQELFVDQISIKYIVLLHKIKEGSPTVTLASKASCIQYLFSLIRPFEGMNNTKLVDFLFELTSGCVPIHVYTLPDINSTRDAILDFLYELENKEMQLC